MMTIKSFYERDYFINSNVSYYPIYFLEIFMFKTRSLADCIRIFSNRKERCGYAALPIQHYYKKQVFKEFVCLR